MINSILLKYNGLYTFYPSINFFLDNIRCEGTAQHQMEMKNALAEMGMPVMTFDGNMADEREFDEARTARMIDLFLTEALRLKKVAA